MAALKQFNSADSLVPLEEKDVARLRIGWRSRLAADDIRRILQTLPGRSMWDTRTLEYAIAAPWRNRTDIVQIAELSAVLHPEEMILAVTERSHELGAALTVIVEVDETRRTSFYERCGYRHLEKVITFGIERHQAPRVVRPRELTFIPVDPGNDEMREILVRLDNRSFPWIWWNSDLEFRVYGLTPGVEVYDGLSFHESAGSVTRDGQPVAVQSLIFPGEGYAPFHIVERITWMTAFVVVTDQRFQTDAFSLVRWTHMNVRIAWHRVHLFSPSIKSWLVSMLASISMIIQAGQSPAP